jgi:phage/plasmid-like protein (TIGR03299 family)
MPANVDQMFSVRQTPWHREGEVLDDYPQTWDEARIAAGLDWEPISAPVFALDGITPEGQPIYRQIDGYQQVARSDNAATLALTADSYPIIGHAEFGEIFEAILETNRDVLKVETGGVLEGGRKVWMLVRLDEPFEVPGDRSLVMPYMAITARHDAKGAVVLRSTMIRIVCANTFRASELEGERTGLTFSFIHRGDWRDHKDQAREAVRGVRREAREYVDLMGRLTGVKITPYQEEQFVTEFIPAPPNGIMTDRVAKNIETARTAVRGILASETIDGSGIRGTAAGLVQAAGEYLDHARAAQSWETKVKRTLIRPEPLKERATKLALEVANA